MTSSIRLKWVTALPSDEASSGFRESVQHYLNPGTSIAPPDPATRGPRHLEYHFYQALTLLEQLRRVKRAEQEGYDGAVINCFYDPGLRESREITSSMVVTAPAEASMHIAATLGHKFSIIVGREKWIPLMHENVVKYGFQSRLASFRSVDMGVLEFHADEQETICRIRNEALAAIQNDRAEVIILGCTAQFGFFHVLQEELHVPVIDSALAAVKYAEFLVGLRKHLGWTHSKICDYESPPIEEIRKWDLEKQYGFEGFWTP